MEFSEKNRDAITRLARSSDAQKLMELLQKQSGQVKQAAQQAAAGEGLHGLAEELEEVLAFVRRFIRFDVLEEPVGEVRLCGYGPEELREHSHYPEQYYGQSHFLPHYTDGPALLALNKVRTSVRRTELAAYGAFRGEEGSVTRPDLLLGLNRLSSLLWILMIKRKAGRYERS